jgi:hypothetical protein
MEVPDPVHPSTEEVGIDSGIATFAATSAGIRHPPLNAYRRVEQKKARIQRRLARMVTYSCKRLAHHTHDVGVQTTLAWGHGDCRQPALYLADLPRVRACRQRESPPTSLVLLRCVWLCIPRRCGRCGEYSRPGAQGEVKRLLASVEATGILGLQAGEDVKAVRVAIGQL